MIGGSTRWFSAKADYVSDSNVPSIFVKNFKLLDGKSWQKTIFGHDSCASADCPQAKLILSGSSKNAQGKLVASIYTINFLG